MSQSLPRLVSIGVHRPDRVVTSRSLEGSFGLAEGWVERRTGVLERRVATTSLEAMGISAAQAAVEAAGLDAADIDLVVFATESSISQSPPIAPSIATAVGADGAGAFDLVAACAGFTYALAVAGDLVRAGTAGTVLVVAAEEVSAWLADDDPSTSVVFGDGAGAAVVTSAPGSKDESGRIGPAAMLSAGRLSHLIGTRPAIWVDAFATSPPTWPRLRMDGPEVYRWAITALPGLIAEALDRAGLAVDDVDVFVPHQANIRIISEVARRSGLEHAVLADDIRLSGNTSSASIPLAIDALLASGRASPGQTALLVGFGAGMTACALAVTLPGRW